MNKQIIWLLFALGVCLSACVWPITGDLPTPAPTAVSLAVQTAVPTTPTPDLPTLAPLPTSAPLPTPTYDPALADWTILVYLDADNNLELPGLLDLNEMEAAGGSDQVNVVVQIDRAVGETAVDGDWTDTRRYLIRGDGNRDVINSEPLESLGEQNMGDPAVLTDFIAWGIRAYPANRYALILWDHGSGWNGIAFDGGAPTLDNADHISLPELETALAQALAASNVNQLDIIGFDACLMGQIDVFQAVQPYAYYAVGSEELTPGLGWDYETVLGHIYANPQMDGAQLATQMVNDFVDHYTLTEPDDFVTMSAVELAVLPQLTHAVERLALALTADPTFVASAIGDARSGAEAYARVYADEFDRYAAVDLHHFASILAQRSPDEQVADVARDVMAEVENAVLSNRHGAGFKRSRGVAIYFPRNAQFYGEEYAQITHMPLWNTFLTTYHDVGLAALPPPQVNLTNVLAPEVGMQHPAFVEMQIIGRDIETVALIAGQALEDGRQRLLEFDHLIPEPTFLSDGSQIVEWRDGVHDDFFIWNTEVTYLFDGDGNGDFVVMWPTDAGSTLFTVQGRYRRAGSDIYFDANLLFNHRTAELTRVWAFQSDESEAPAELLPQPGDEFQIYDLYYNAGLVTREPGPSLFFDDQRKLYFDWRPLPDGPYFFGFAAENVAGDTGVSFFEMQVDNSELVDGYQAYLDPYLGFQFLYPESWFTPRYQDTLLYTSERDGNIQLQVTLYPNLEASVTAETLKTETLNQFGPVDILFEDDLLVSGMNALRTAYGYTKANEGDHTGIFLTFVKDGTGYVIDVDGLSADEPATIDAAATIADSWEFLPAGVGLQPGRWATIDLETFSIAQPPSFTYQESNGWDLFGAGTDTFVALRTQAATLEPEAVVAALVRDLRADSFVEPESVTAGDPFLFPLAGVVWVRVDFSYISAADGEEIWGYMMVRHEAGKEIAVWVEAPSHLYNDLESAVFLTMIADFTLTE